jgi:flagellum-specific ATP synthase
MAGVSINPLAREPITQPLDVGVRAINALLPIGRGQRVGLFAGSGVGKSTLLGMMTRYTAADVIVVGLIGERGREVRDFVETTLGEKACAAPWWWPAPPTGHPWRACTVPTVPPPSPSGSATRA